MNQQTIVSACLAVWAASILMVNTSCSQPDTAQQSSRPPNVILVMTDDQGYGDIGALGNTMIETPNIDQLHARSVRLTDFHVDPTCSPTRSALLSGRYSSRTGVWHTIMGRSIMNTNELTMAEVFAANGYRTAMFGKWHLGDNYPSRPQDQGFHETFYNGGGGVGQGPDYWGNDYFDDTYFRDGKPEKVTGYCTDVWFDNALSFIENNKHQPFFVYLPTNAAHSPFNVAEKYSQPYKDKGVPQTMANFYGMITNIDENMGRLMTRLEELNLDDNTILIFSTDNGTAAGRVPKEGEEGAWQGFNGGMRGNKGSEYEGGHRVPFFIRWPAGHLDGGRDVDQLTAHIDVLPTFIELAGLTKPDGPAIDGTSLSPILRGDTEALRDRTLLVHSQRIPYPEKWRKSAVMTERWRLINGAELYDLKADPAQQNDVATEHTDVVGQLRGDYEDWWRSLSTAFDEDVRIAVGTEHEPRTQLYAHDWHSRETSPWNQTHLQEGLVNNGPWSLDIKSAGDYEITLRRWPEQVNESIEATKARLKVGAFEQSRSLPADATEATFRVTLAEGPASLQTWLTLADGQTRGAYFVYLKRL